MEGSATSRYPNSLETYFKTVFKRVFTLAAPKADTLDLLRAAVRTLQFGEIERLLTRVSWHGLQSKFFIGVDYFNPDGGYYDVYFRQDIDPLQLPELDAFDELGLRVNLQLINDLLLGYVQFEHIQPLLKRIESAASGLRKVVSVNADTYRRSCNRDIAAFLQPDNQEVLPLLIAKHYYESHKESVANPPNKTKHLIIDEAHNILSEQSARDKETWKDYRLELFEEMIKEGRNFGLHNHIEPETCRHITDAGLAGSQLLHSPTRQ